MPFNDYPTKGNQGDSSKCRSLLAAAGYPDGLTLKDSYRANPLQFLVFQAVQSDFAKCGVQSAASSGAPLRAH